MGDILCKLVVGGVTYGCDTTNRLLKVTHNEQPDSQTAIVLIENADNNLSALSLEGLGGILSYGYHTTTDKYSATAPLRVKAQESFSAGGSLICLLNLYGIPDQMNEDEASANYIQESGNTNTIKMLIDAITGATLACYSHCTAIPVTYDTGYDDGIINSFMPKDYFRIYKGETRLAKLKWLLGNTYDVMRVENDAGVGTIHILQPESVNYDYLYDDIILATNHTFFSKVYRTRLVTPNRIVVESSPDHSPQYSGEATISGYASLNAANKHTHFVTKRLISDAQALAIATAQIQRLELDHERGSGLAPMNVGQEVYDYVKITDSREGDNRDGNVGWLVRNYQPGKFDFSFGFGSVLLGSLIGTGQGLTTTEQPFVTYAEFTNQINEIYNNLNNQLTLIDALISVIEQMQESVPKWHVTQQMIIPVYVTE